MCVVFLIKNGRLFARAYLFVFFHKSPSLRHYLLVTNSVKNQSTSYLMNVVSTVVKTLFVVCFFNSDQCGAISVSQSILAVQQL